MKIRNSPGIRSRKRRRRICLIFLTAALFFCLARMDRFSDLFPWARTAGTEHGWNLILVNSDYRIPRKWEIEFTVLSNGEQVDQRMYPDLQQMFDDMRSQGVYPVVASGYRTDKEQQALMDEKIQQLMDQGYTRGDAKVEARRWVAEPGHSEHQTGLAVDINGESGASGTAVYQWLADNAWKYGFILRYPEDKEAITGTAYEPWHYRYVGKSAAEEIYHQQICLEEYINDMDYSE